MDTSVGLLRIELDGRWSAEDVSRCYASLSDLYDLRLFLELLRDDQREWEHVLEEMLDFPPFRHAWRRRLRGWGGLPWAPGFGAGQLPAVDEAQLDRVCRMFEPEERLQVRRISYASPGASDLAGIGTVVGHLKDFVVRLIERRDGRRQRELADDRASLENDRLRLENARNFVALGRDLGYSEAEMRVLMLHADKKQGALIQLIEQQKIRSVSEPNGNDRGAEA